MNGAIYGKVIYKNRLINSECMSLYMLFLPQVYFYLSSILESFNTSLSSSFLYFAYAICAICVYCEFLRIAPHVLFLSVFIFACALVFSVLLSPDIINYLTYSSSSYGFIVYLLIIYLPVFLGITHFSNSSLFFKRYLQLSRITLVLVIVAFVSSILIKKSGVSSGDYMTFAYYSLPEIYACSYFGMKKRNKLDIILSLVSSVIILVGGCRGALVTLFVYFVLEFFLLRKHENTKRRVLITIIVLFLCLVIVLRINSIIRVLSDFLSSIGYSSRILTTISGRAYQDVSSFFDSSGRYMIWKNSFYHMGLFDAYGLLGDRLILHDTYPHNIILEMMLNYGILLGLLLFISLVFLWFKSYLKARNNPDMVFLCISAFSVFFVKLMISASYIQSSDFYFYLGFLFFLCGTTKEKINWLITE